MNKTLLGLAALLSTFALGQTAEAQNCGYPYTFCAQVQIGVPAPPPPVVYAPPPPPRVVYVAPRPAPVVVVRPRPAPRVVYYESAPVTVEHRVVTRPERQLGLGAHLAAAAVSENEDPMGGFGAHLRYRTSPRFAVEGTLDVFHGLGTEGLPRREVPLTVNGLWYVNPESRFQLYFLAGVGLAAAEIGDDSSPSEGPTVNTAFAGMQAGVGAELRLGRHFAVSGDVRGFPARPLGRRVPPPRGGLRRRRVHSLRGRGHLQRRRNLVLLGPRLGSRSFSPTPRSGSDEPHARGGSPRILSRAEVIDSTSFENLAATLQGAEKLASLPVCHDVRGRPVGTQDHRRGGTAPAACARPRGRETPAHAGAGPA